MESIEKRKTFKDTKKAQADTKKRLLAIEKLRKPKPKPVKKKKAVVDVGNEFLKRYKNKKRMNIPQCIFNDALVNIVNEYYTLIPKKFTLKKLADYIYSEYIRFTKSDDWICECITCKTKIPRNHTSTRIYGNAIQNWHFKVRRFLKYRYMDDNCSPQCYFCNCCLNWNYQKYTMVMIKKFWLEWVENVLNDNTIYSISNYQYVEMIIWWYNVLKNKN